MTGAHPTVAHNQSARRTGTFHSQEAIAAASGTYSGLFYPAGGATQSSSGYLTATLGNKGAGTYSAHLLLDGGGYSFSGRFDANGQSQTVVNRPGKTPLNATLHLDLDPADGRMTGQIKGEGWQSDPGSRTGRNQSETGNQRHKHLRIDRPEEDRIRHNQRLRRYSDPELATQRHPTYHHDHPRQRSQRQRHPNRPDTDNNPRDNHPALRATLLGQRALFLQPGFNLTPSDAPDQPPPPPALLPLPQHSTNPIPIIIQK